jgi:glutathione peroxidase
MNIILTLFFGMIAMTTNLIATPNNSPTNIYSFSFESISGKNIPLETFKGKVVLIVNTASNCGFTKQYDSLEKLYQKYKDRGLVIIGVPSNDFGGQEPGDEKDIQNFCKINFGVTFPMTKKEIVSGKNAHPFYIWAKKELGFGTAPKWNFHKYLINTQGKLVNYFYSTTKPDSNKITKAIEELLE